MADLNKANEIIHRKMDDHRQLKEKYRRNTELIKRQEKFLNDKDDDIKARKTLKMFYCSFFLTSTFIINFLHQINF
jgi:hypothetical protein